ncbi:MAG: radical SAM protein [Deltaproteobacteria bacterium]|nr:radical SAM protein [Deltaproteobacteria bacterium]
MKKTRVFLGNAPWRKAGYYGVRAGSRWPHFEEEKMEYMPFPFFLAYAAAVIERAEYPVLLVDAIAEGSDDVSFYGRIDDFRPHIILMEISTNSINKDLEIMREVRGRFPEALLVLAGLHSDMYATQFLKDHAEPDAVLVGEYEFSFLELVDRFEAGADLKGTRGTIVRAEDGEIVDGGRRDLEMDMLKFPWPARHFLPMLNYRDEPGNLPRPSVQMWASRGCPYKCTFCAWPQIMYGNHKYRIRPVKDVVDEMEWLFEHYGFESAYFDDDTFNLGKKRMLEFAREVKSRNMGRAFGIMARADNMDREILEALKDAGLWGLKYGVESAEQQILDNCEKDLDIEKVKTTVALTHELGIKMHMTFMFGLPGETTETAKKTIDLALDFRARVPSVHRRHALPGHQILAPGKRGKQTHLARFRQVRRLPLGRGPHGHPHGQRTRTHPQRGQPPLGRIPLRTPPPRNRQTRLLQRLRNLRPRRTESVKSFIRHQFLKSRYIFSFWLIV